MGEQSTWLVAAWLIGAGLLFLLDLAMSTALLSVSTLSRVALRHVNSESGDAFPFLEEIKSPYSTHRAAVHLARQMGLLGGTLLVGLAGRRAGWQHPWLLGILVGALVGVLMIETLVARLLVMRDPRAVLRASSVLVGPIHFLAYPLLAPILFGLRRHSESDSVGEEDREMEADDEEVDAFIEVGERDGILEAEEGRMVRGIVELGETRVREIMTPRPDIIALSEDTTIGGARPVFTREGHSRLPVYRGTIDNVVGVLHVRDLVRAWDHGGDDAPISGHLRPPFFVPETQSVSELLGEMRIRTHIALVVDEHGSLVGLVTLEDLLEEIVGDIRDEHDSEEARFVEEADGSCLVSGLAHVEEVENRFHLDISGRDFDTVGGLVMSSLGRVPQVGEVFESFGLRIEVLRADRRRIYRVRMRRIGPPEEGEADVS